jgi:hypothetical protein
MRGAYVPPSGEISRRVEISMALEATPETGELGLTATIPLIDKATAATGPAGVPWVHEHDRNACPGRVSLACGSSPSPLCRVGFSED